jgi:hypothetical protein
MSFWLAIRSMSWLMSPPTRSQVAHPPIRMASGTTPSTSASTRWLSAVSSGG